MDFVMVPDPQTTTKPGKLFIEGCVRADVDDSIGMTELQEILETHFSSHDVAFELLEDIMISERRASIALGRHLPLVQSALESLKVVEYLGPKVDTSTFSSNTTRIEVKIYELYSNPREVGDGKDFPEGEITSMPHARFDRTWDNLVFAEDIKGDLIWMMTNILRFSSKLSECNDGDMYPLILLHGPPGTGKTSLCQGLAQKIAIRLDSKYEYTSESAKQVDEIFTKVARMCQDEPNAFTCVLIDEVESIAASREFSTSGGESHDSLRATNALLTGLDKTRTYGNLIYLCTSNMLEALDSAFVDRCGLKRKVAAPSLASQYEILRQKLLHLISTDIIQTTIELPPFEDARLHTFGEKGNAAARLYDIAHHTNGSNNMSGRSIAQLPKRAVLQCLREEQCDLDMALTFIEQLVKPAKLDREDRFNAEDGPRTEQRDIEVVIRGKRTFKISFESDSDIEEVEWRTKKGCKKIRQD